MKKSLVVTALLASSLLASNQALAAKPELTQEQLTKARASASQLNPPVNFDALMEEADRLNVECTGDLTRKARIIICGQDVENARIKIDTEARKARIQAIEADTEATRKENTRLIREIQQRVKENK
jgi:preprotein translocase subunit SecD